MFRKVEVSKYRSWRILSYNLFILLLLVSFASVYHKIFCRGVSCSMELISGSDYLVFTLRSLIRPIFFAPAITAIEKGAGFSLSLVLYSAHSAVGVVIPYMIGQLLNSNLIEGWLIGNLPDTYKAVKRNKLKIIVFMRFLLPFIALDVVSMLFGVFRFGLLETIFLTFLTELFVGALGGILLGGAGPVSIGIVIIAWVVVLTAIFLMVRHEMIRHSKKASVIDAGIAIYNEILGEIVSRNNLDEKLSGDHAIQSLARSKEVIVICYGFFSSRKSVGQLKEGLEAHGYEVVVPRMPGLFGVFNTEGLETVSERIELECRRLAGEDRIFHVVGFSKGGLAASYMFAKNRDRVGATSYFSIAAPYGGTYLTYLLLFTPLGFYWHDVWDMRPGSEYLSYIRNRLHKVKNLKIYSLFSGDDKVAGREAKIDFADATEIETNLTHFEYLTSPETVKIIVENLGKRANLSGHS
jgi:pimeloyl-ACP methyl ester carboxylesterase